VEPAADCLLGTFSAPWRATRHRAVPCLIAYLDDLKFPDELYLLGPVERALKEEGPAIGVWFENRAKNCLYVPRPFRQQAVAMFPDAVFVDENSPGGSPAGRHSAAIAENRLSGHGNRARPLVNCEGIEMCVGAPLRLVESAADEASVEWIAARTAEMVETTGVLFACLGLGAVTAWRGKHSICGGTRVQRR
jgi:hypothetical protein